MLTSQVLPDTSGVELLEISVWKSQIFQAIASINNLISITWGQFWPPGIVVACVCVRVRVHVRECLRPSIISLSVW